MVLLWLHTAITIPINQANNITGTYASGVYLYADSDNNTNKPKPKITTTGTYYQGVYLEAYSKLQQTKKKKTHKNLSKKPPSTKNNKKMRYNRKQHSIKHSHLIIINTNYKKSNNYLHKKYNIK
nr:hypothetical protein [Methanobrevibacter arboriphilus]